MDKLKVAIVFGQKPNFNKDAMKYFILSLNKIQNTYEFFFPNLNKEVFPKGQINYHDSLGTLDKFINDNNIISDFCAVIITNKFHNNFFFNAETDYAVITTDGWDKYFSPPSLFEYLMHTIYCCLLYSQKIPDEKEISEDAMSISINSHYETKGCVADFTQNKHDDRIDIILGYICEKHQREIREVFGEEYLKETIKVLERDWIGHQDVKGSVAYNLKHVFKFDINKDSGFNKNWFENFKEKFYDIPGETLGEVIKVLLTAYITYLLVKYGISK